MSAVMIGIAVSRREVRVVATHRHEVLWVTQARRERTGTLAGVIEGILSTRPPALKRGVRVVAVIGASESQLRPLSGLPPVRNVAELHAMVAENVDRFFVREGGAVRVSTPCATPSGDTWASAVDETVISEIAAACRTTRVRLLGAIPMAAVLHHIAPSDIETTEREMIWVGEGTRTCITYDGWAPRRVARERASDAEPEGLVSPMTLPEEVEASHADAYAATRVSHRDPFLVGEYADADLVDRRSKMRSWMWSAAAVASVTVAMVMPGLLSIRQSAQARAHLAVLRRKVGEAEKTQRELAAATTELNLVSRFQGSRRSVTLLLGELALALPESTAIASLRIDSLGGNLSIITPHAAAAVEAMSTVPGIHRVQVAGSMTRETTNGMELERATIRFGFVGTGRAP